MSIMISFVREVANMSAGLRIGLSSWVKNNNRLLSSSVRSKPVNLLASDGVYAKVYLSYLRDM